MLEDPQLMKIADEMGATPAQTVLAYLLKRDLVVIPKSATPSRIKSNYEVILFRFLNEKSKGTIKIPFCQTFTKH